MPKNTFFEDDYEDFSGEKLDNDEELEKENTLEDDYNENEEWEGKFNDFYEDDELDYEELRDAEKEFRHTRIPDPDFNF
ncbi:hypothetical protein HMPREF0202_02743 [Cetobacterium somerae ATCC BAA-474]|uniref:Uncharacterized protein n=1 Tax=Cetobacterium somerae ATCC BAA-474 TaxID=1319815 RepID=U7V2J6_9FUSO|nr:hypothetical protein [Cetobacterium somerae]ERT65770.1 hypothetical protein HMPREF0202_02743 [Cetobacterium somerae ATCC BAA-474]